GDDFDESEFERRLQAHPNLALCAGWYWIRKLQGRFFGLDPGAALEAAAKAETFLWTARSFPEVADYHYYAGLAHAAAHDDAPGDRRLAPPPAHAEHPRPAQGW